MAATMTSGRRSKHRCDDFPTRGRPGGWRDVWDAPDTDTEVLRLVAATIRQRQDAAAAIVRAAIARDDA